MSPTSLTVPTVPAWPSAEEALADRDALLALLFAWAERDWIRDLDAALAHRLAQLAPEGNASCLLAAMLVSHQAGQGHLLLDLTQAHERPTTLIAVEPEEDSPPTPESLLALLPTPLWLEALHHWSAVDSDPRSPSAQNSPLVLEGQRLYLRRYWRHEQQVADAIARRLAPTTVVDATQLRPVLDSLFPAPDSQHDPEIGRAHV